MPRNQHGFTLIELTIVIAIIGILAAIEIPNFIRKPDGTHADEQHTSSLSGLTTASEYFSEAVTDLEEWVASFLSTPTPPPTGTPIPLTSGTPTGSPIPLLSGMQTQMQGAVNGQLGNAGIGGIGGSSARPDPAKDHTPQDVPLTLILER